MTPEATPVRRATPLVCPPLPVSVGSGWRVLPHRCLTGNEEKGDCPRPEGRHERGEHPMQLEITETDEGYRLTGELDMATAET